MSEASLKPKHDSEHVDPVWIFTAFILLAIDLPMRNITAFFTIAENQRLVVFLFFIYIHIHGLTSHRVFVHVTRLSAGRYRPQLQEYRRVIYCAPYLPT